MELSDIAAVSGKSGLFKILKPTRTGAILETLDGSNKKLVVGAHSKVSILSDISIYTTDGEGSIMLSEVLKKIHEEFSGDTGLSSSSDADEFKSFLKFVLPEYDEDRVYLSDIKKLVSWYTQLVEIDESLLNGVPNKEVKEEDENNGNEDSEKD